MGNTLARHFICASVAYALIGMALGIHMAASHDHGQLPTHAHLMLLGWVGMTIYAVTYKIWPDAAGGWAPRVHAVLAHASLIALSAGLFLIYGGNVETGEPIASVASLVAFANMALFGWIVWRGTY